MHMNCKYCNAELEEGSTVCPACGEDNQDFTPVETAPLEEPVETAPLEESAEPPAAEAKAPVSMTPGIRMTPGRLTLLITLAVAALAVVAALIVASFGGRDKKPENPQVAPTSDVSTPSDGTEPGDAPTEGTIPADGNSDDATCKGSYTVDDETVLAARDTVVATVGDAKLTVGQLQVYYWRGFYDFLNNYGSYVPYIGLDPSLPLDTQTCTMFDGTWQQYFLQSALANWHRYQALAMEAKSSGFTLDAESQDFLDNLETSLNSTAASYGFESGEDMLKTDLGPTATVDDYKDYMYLSYAGYQYFSAEYDKLSPTEEEIEAYFQENAEDLAANGVTKESEDFYVDVRHILIQPEGGAAGTDGKMTYTDEEWAACEAAAQDVLDSWLAGDRTEESFARFANDFSQDPGSNTSGGLYDNLEEGRTVPEFNDWCFDEARQEGDYALVKTTYGYHVMYFCRREPVWHARAQAGLMSQLSDALISSAADKHPMEVDYSAIVLSFVDQSNPQQ